MLSYRLEASASHSRLHVWTMEASLWAGVMSS